MPFMRSLTLLFTFLLLIITQFESLEQVCNAPTGINLSTQNETCPNNGTVRVTSVSPSKTIVSNAGDFYEYRLVDANNNNNNIIRNWQQSDEFLNVTKGMYKVQIRRYCNSSALYSSVLTSSSISSLKIYVTALTETIARHERCFGNAIIKD